MGVSKANIERSEDRTNISFSHRKLIFDGNRIKKDQGFNFYIQNEILHMKGKPNLGVTMVDNSPYVITEDYQGTLKNLKESQYDKDLTLLLFTLKEITTKSTDKETANSIAKTRTKGCGFWNIVVFATGGIGRSTSEERFNNKIDAHVKEREQNNGVSCSSYGGSDTSCAFGNHACISTQSFCCK